jgi:Tol biopolymer transport system component
MKRFAFARTSSLFVALLAAAGVHASGRPLTPDDFYRIQDVHEPQVSPDGLRVAYLVSHNDRDADEVQTTLWMVGWDGGGPVQLTHEGRDETSPASKCDRVDESLLEYCSIYPDGSSVAQ